MDMFTRDRGYSAPSFDRDPLGMDKISGNVVYFFKPAQHRRFSLQAVRSNRYSFTDRFVNQAGELIHRASTTGNPKGLNDLLKSDDGLNSTQISQNVDAVVDLNRVNQDYKFILVLNHFKNKRMAGGATFTTVITGRCDDEPVIIKNQRSLYNPDCTLIIEGKTTFQTYNANALGDSGRSTTTRMSNGWAYKDITGECTSDVMYTNTPGGMNHNADIDPVTQEVTLGDDPVDEVGAFGPTTFNRKQQMPGHILAKMMHAVNRTARDKETDRLLPIENHENTLPTHVAGRDGHDRYSTLVDNLRQAEGNTAWQTDHIGPSVNSTVRAPALESEWGVTEVKVFDQSSLDYWDGTDQTDITARGMFESILATQIPVLMIESQIHALAFDAESYINDLGMEEVNIFIRHVVPVIPTITPIELRQKTDAITHSLERGIFKQIQDTGGDFTLGAKINLTSTSSLALHYLDDGPADDHHHEFFPSEFALTTPLIGTRDVVRENQKAIGHFLGEVCRGMNDDYIPDEPMDIPRGVPPRRRASIDTRRGVKDRLQRYDSDDAESYTERTRSRNDDDFGSGMRW